LSFSSLQSKIPKKEWRYEAMKQPKWDRQEGPPIVVSNPDGPNSNPSLTEPLKVGQEAIGTIGGVEIVVMLSEIITPTQAKGEITQILNGLVEMETLGDLSLGDTVLIKRDEMYSLNIDPDIP
jgi:hypothetical protein